MIMTIYYRELIARETSANGADGRRVLPREHRPNISVAMSHEGLFLELLTWFSGSDVIEWASVDG